MAWSEAVIPSKQLNDGTWIPVLAIGTGKSEDHKNYIGQDCNDSVTAALRLGVRHIDTGERFENEASVAKALGDTAKVKRQDVYLSVKRNIEAVGNTRLPLKEIDQSLALLQTDKTDLYLVHSSKTFLSLLGIRKGWADMEQVHRDGKATSFGVASFTHADLEELLSSCTIKPTVLQCEFHPYVYQRTKPLLELCKQHNITTSCFGTLVPLYKHTGGPIDEAVEQIAKKAGLSQAQVLWKWAGQVSGGVIVMRSENEQHIEEAVTAVTGESLHEQDIDHITEAGKEHHFRRYQKHLDSA